MAKLVDYAAILASLESGRQYTIREVAKLHGASDSSMAIIMYNMETMNRLICTKQSTPKLYKLNESDVIPHFIKAKPYQYPKAMLDQFARCAEARQINSLGGD